MTAVFLLLLHLHPFSSWTERITNRRYISHILYEPREGLPALSILTTHPRQDAFKSDSHRLHYHCQTAELCLNELSRLNQHLRSGHNIHLTLRGSQILRIRYLTEL